MVRHITLSNTNNNYTWVRNCAIFEITKKAGLSVDERFTLQSTRLIPTDIKVIDWEETVWRSDADDPVNHCIIADSKYGLHKCATLKFQLRNPRQYNFRIVGEEKQNYYLIDYLTQLRKIGPRLIWQILIPEEGEFCAADGETWEQATTRPANPRKIVFRQDGEITWHNDFNSKYGPMPAFGSEFALANAANNAV
ncbi:hypothetical protein MMC34_007289 [Xylographa carneopallida]|nr:hypothetical protein [Xylographa carneopallida]